MGGGRVGVFPGTTGSDNYQESIWDQPVRVRHRGPTFVVNAENSAVNTGITTGNATGSRTKKVILLTAIDVLKQCMLYRAGAITEFQFISWISYRLQNKRYHIEPSLRMCLEQGVMELKSTRTSPTEYNIEAFFQVLTHFENKLESLLPP